jgi:hypothetical protein
VAIDGQLFIVLLLAEVRVGCQNFVRAIKIKLLGSLSALGKPPMLFIADSLLEAN